MSAIKMDEATQIRSGENIEIDILGKYLQENIQDFGTIKAIKQFPGGFSNLTYQIESQKKTFVLRRPPIGANIKSAHDMAREYKVLSLLEPFYAEIPKPILFCENEQILGGQFYLMEKVNGVILRGKNAKEYDFSTNKMKEISEKLIDNLILLHNIDIENNELACLGKPDGYVDRQVEGWIGRYEKSKTDELNQMDDIAIWLNKNKPKYQKATFIHNDYKYDNVVFNESLTKITAVLDWEMATIGDPLMDLGATLAYWCQAEDGAFLRSMNLTWLPGNLSRSQVVEHYAIKTGRYISDILFYFVFGLYKNAVILQQIYARWKKGITTDARFAQLIHGVNELTNLAILSVEKNSI
jgi:aminoglycoside phosphotransferase (APT) family kinase protein